MRFPVSWKTSPDYAALAKHFPERISEIARLESEIGNSFFPHSKVPATQHPAPGIKSVIAWAHDSQRSADSEAWACMSHFGKCEYFSECRIRPIMESLEPYRQALRLKNSSAAN